MRETIAIKQDGLLLHGTAHLGPVGHGPGILFVNSGSLPRSSRGDLCVYLADSLAAQGFKCFRVDLPGLGDSPGEIPREYLDFYKFVQEGGYAECVSKIERTLRRKYVLNSIVLLGICGGAQTSVFAAARERHPSIAGLILLDMPFFLFRETKSTSNREAGHPLWGWILSCALNAKARMHDWLLAQRWEPYATTIYRRLRTITNRPKGGSLPANTNISLLRALSGLLDQGIPTLLITAHPPISDPPAFDYIGYLNCQTGRMLEHSEIHGTTHSFVEGGGAEAVLKTLSIWLAKHFSSP